MSKADQDKWDERYHAGAFAERTHPSALLNEWIARLPPGRALDLACGAGRNALFLARNGFEVTAVDISPAGLERARCSARQTASEIDWRQRDLDEPLNIIGNFQVICLFRYMNQPLIRRLPKLLAPGGVLLVEEHLAADQSQLESPIAGPSNPAFLIAPGELPALLDGLTVLHQEEGVVMDPDGRHVALSRFVGTNDQGTQAARSAR